MAESFNKADTPTKFARVVEEIRPGAKFTLLRGTDTAQFVATWDDDTRIVTEHWAIRGLNHSQMLHYLRPHVEAQRVASLLMDAGVTADDAQSAIPAVLTLAGDTH